MEHMDVINIREKRSINHTNIYKYEHPVIDFFNNWSVRTDNVTLDPNGWTTEDLVFKWKKDDSVQVAVFHLPRFTLKEYNPSTCDSKTNTGKCYNVFFYC